MARAPRACIRLMEHTDWSAAFGVVALSVVLTAALPAGAASSWPNLKVRSACCEQAANANKSAPASKPTYRYRPKYRVPPSLESIQKHVIAGSDTFPEEKTAEDLAVALKALGASLRDRPGGVTAAAEKLLARQFAGGRLVPPTDTAGDSVSSPLDVSRTPAPEPEPSLDRARFQRELQALVGRFASIDVAEFLITSIEAASSTEGGIRTIVRFDFSGAAKGGGREERIGRWRMLWRRDGSDWKVVEWTALESVRSRATAPVFTETTSAAFGRNPSFGGQLRTGLDDWITRIDSAFMPGGMGHHGVSAGDADGDGLDDLYVSQPSGLPNRLFRNNGDGTFTDITEAAGLAVLDSTSQSLFADVENDGDQDLILVTRSEPLLFTNDGKGRFTRVPKAFQLAQQLRGTLTSAAVADYDRDGFLDLYLCAYSFLIGASEDKAGPPAPYHDAQNGPPNLLFRNDGHGRFVEVTDSVGLNDNNDRFSFAPAWGDYDEDGWPDLLVSNDFGRKNLYRNLGGANGQVRFQDVADRAGVSDHGAGMSAAFLDFDNDGHLDIYTGNMWSAAGLRVTAQAAFMPQASAGIRDLYRRHARGNSLFRNRGDGTFDDVTLQAGAEFGRWAWSSDAIDIDSDGWEDLFIVNGMFTRAANEAEVVDIDSFFWRQLVARSPLVRQTGTPYDDAWRATNRLLMTHGAQASHERDVLLHNNGRGGFDEISGTSGLDLDQDGRSFAVLDYDGDGDPDMAIMAPRASPQLRLFRNDWSGKHAALAVRLIGTKSNRDAVGARVTVETDQGHFTRVVRGGSGFISQPSKELLFGLGKSTRVLKATIVWPSGLVQTLVGMPVDQRVRVTEGGDDVQTEPFRHSELRSASRAGTSTNAADSSHAPDRGTWLYQPYPAPDFTVRDLAGQAHSLSALSGHAVALLFWATWAPPSRVALEELSRQRQALEAAAVSVLAVSVDRPEDESTVRAAAQGLDVPIAIAGEDVAGMYGLLHRYLFDRRADLPLPTLFLLNAKGEVAKVYRDPGAAAKVVTDVQKIEVPDAERLARAVPFPGTFHANPGERSYFQYGLELSEQGYDAASLVAFEHVAAVDPSAITFYNLGTLYMRRQRSAEARSAFERSLQLQPDYADANNSLGALLAQAGDLPAAIERFRAALESRPEFADALNNLGFALFQSGQADRAHELYEKALTLQPDFPEALNNLGIFFGSRRDLDRALTYFQQAVDKRSTYGEAANNLALVLAARGDTDKAILVLQRLLQENPGFDMAYVTLCRIYLQTGRRQEGTQVLERLLQRNPTHPLGLQLLQQIKAGQ